MTIANTFDQLVVAAREALAALDEQDTLLVEQLRSMAGEAEQRAEQRRRIEACLDALVPVSLPPAVSEPVEEETPAAAAVPPEVHSPPAPGLVIRQVPASSLGSGRRYCPGCGGSWGSILHRAHMEAVDASEGQLLRETAWAPIEEPATAAVPEVAPAAVAPPAANDEAAPAPPAHVHHFMFGNVPDAAGVLHGSCACGQDSSAPQEPENTKQMNGTQRAARAAAAEALAVPA